MRRFITIFFTLTALIWFLCSIILAVAWLFDSQPQNLYWVWTKLCNALVITFLFHLLFGGKK